MSTSPRGLPVIIAALAGLVVTLVLMVLVSPYSADGSDVALASATTMAAVDGGHPGTVASDHSTGRAPVIAAAVRMGAWTPVGVAAVAALLAGGAADRRRMRRIARRPAARYALCVMRT